MPTLRELRKSKNLSQEELAEILGISQEHVSNMESGRRKPSFELYQAMKRYFNTDIDF